MALGCSTKASFLHPPGPPRALRERCAHPSGTCEAAGGQGWGLERSKRRGSQGCRGPYSPCPGRRQLCRCDKSAWGLQGSRSSPWRLGSRQSQRRGNPSPLCPRKWLCTLCRGSGEQSCLLTTVGGDPEAMIPPGAGWGVQGTVGTLWLTSVGPQPRVHPDMAAGVASALWDQRGPGRAWGKEQLGNPRLRRWALPLGASWELGREPFLLETVAGRMEMSPSAEIFPRDQGLLQPQSLNPGLLSLRCAPSPLPCLCALLPRDQPQGHTPTPGQASTSSGSKPPETFNKNKYGCTA